MKELPLDAILPRATAVEVTRRHFTKQLELMREMADYGSNLIIRAFNSSPKGLPEIVICGVLLKQVVAMLDAAEVLLTAGASQAAYLQARAAFEASICLDWVLKGDSQFKAACYYVANLRAERHWTLRATKGSPEERDFNARVASVGGLDVHATRPDLAQQVAKRLAEIDRELAKPEYVSIVQQFDQRKKKRHRDVGWYALTGATSISDIARKVNREPEYLVLYSRGSTIMHAGAYKDHIKVGGNAIEFMPIRHAADFNDLLNFLCFLVMTTYEAVLQAYRPGEVPQFKTKYAQDWRAALLSVAHVDYQF